MQKDNIKDVDAVMSMCNLTEYSGAYSKTLRFMAILNRRAKRYHKRF